MNSATVNAVLEDPNPGSIPNDFWVPSKLVLDLYSFPNSSAA
jgi:hypothetical protein